MSVSASILFCRFYSTDSASVCSAVFLCLSTPWLLPLLPYQQLVVLLKADVTLQLVLAKPT